jgi:tripartite-type tricarboxylate transporter receptor subunit TctC
MHPEFPAQGRAPMTRRLAVSLALGLAGLSGLASAAPAAAAWPDRPLRLVVGFPAGSSPDLMARTIAEPLSQVLGQPVLVDNRPGAGGNIGANLVARATDRHTFGVMINGNMTVAKILNPEAPYDPLKDLAPVSLLGTAPLVLVTTPRVPGQGPAFLAAGRQAGAQWSYGSPGVGTVAHLGLEVLNASAGMKAVHVPYPGNPQVINAMIAGDIQLALLPPGLAMPQVRAGKLQAVGVTSPGRSALVPEVPSLAEAGLAGFQLEIWNAVAAPAGQPQVHIERLATLLSEIVRRPEVRARIYAQGWQVAGTSPEGLARRIQRDTQQMRAVIERNQIRPQ